MTGGFIPQLLLSASIGLMLAFVGARRAVLALLLFAMTAVLGFVVPPIFSAGIVLAALLLTASVAAILVYVRTQLWTAFALPLCLIAGYWLGARTAQQSDNAVLALTVIPAFLVIPANWLKSRNLDVVIKVAASWLIAIASLSAVVSLIPSARNNADHME